MIDKSSFKNVGRLVTIGRVFAKHGFMSFVESVDVGQFLTADQFKSIRDASKETWTESAPKRLRAAFEELGPAFVKLGQLLASREDIVNEAFSSELRKLQKEVKTLPFSEIQQILIEEIPDQTLFSEISEAPLAAGSIGQVHVGTLKSGEKVVIKVQRPGISDIIDTDVALIQHIASLLERYVGDLKVFQPSLIVEEFSWAVKGELDFIREAANTEKVSAHFSDNPDVIIPKVFWDLTTSRVLTQEFIDGYMVDDNQDFEKLGFDGAKLVETGLNAFLKMVFIDGLYHGDLHAGNLLAVPGNRIGMIDFGLCVRLGRSTRESLAGLLVSLVEEDFESLVSHFLAMTSSNSHVDTVGFEQAVSNELAPYLGLKFSRIKTGALLWRLAKISARHGAPMPRPLILFFKTLASFEGIGTRLSPNMDIMQLCHGFSRDMVSQMYTTDYLKKQSITIARDFLSLARTAPRQTSNLLQTISSGDLQVRSPDLRYVASTFDKLVSRIAVSVIVASLIVGSSILVLAKVGREYYHMSFFGIIGFSLAGILGFYIIYSILRGDSKRLF